MEAFKQSYEFTKRWEGGFSNHPNDPGGATNYGVSLRFLKGLGLRGDFNEDGRIDIDDIRAMTPEDAEALFHEYFWVGMGLDGIEGLEALRCALFDGGVNLGRGRCVKHLQYALNVALDMDLAVDGALGPKTREALDKLTAPALEMLVTRVVLDQRLRHYAKLGRKKKYREFLAGWCNRLDDLRGYLQSLEIQRVDGQADAEPVPEPKPKETEDKKAKAAKDKKAGAK